MSKPEFEADKFSAALEDILDDVNVATQDALNAAVRVGIRKGKQEVMDGAVSVGAVRTGAYSQSWRYRLDKSGEQPEGHVYSVLPGLPHLLEKGHATIGGGFVSAREHIAPAAERAFETTEEELEDRLRSYLGGT